MYIDYLIIFCFFIFSIIGFQKGFLKELILIFNFFIAYIISNKNYFFLSNIINTYLNIVNNNVIIDAISLFIIFCIILIILNSICNIFLFHFIQKIVYSKLNKLLGCLFGIIKSFVIIDFLLINYYKLLNNFNITVQYRSLNESVFIPFFNAFNDKFLLFINF